MTEELAPPVGGRSRCGPTTALGRVARETLNAAMPSGVPSPVGPSQPAPAWQRTAGLHEPVVPAVTSFSLLRWAYRFWAGMAASGWAPARAYAEAMIGAAALV